jgi:hypothetical protein
MRVLEEGLAVGEDGIVNGVPITPRVPWPLLKTLRAQRPTCSVIQRPERLGHLQTCRGDSGVLLGPGSHETTRLWTSEPSLVPDQACRVSVDGQINEFHLRAVFHVGDDPAGRTSLHYSDALHVHA